MGPENKNKIKRKDKQILGTYQVKVMMIPIVIGTHWNSLQENGQDFERNEGQKKYQIVQIWTIWFC